MLILEAGTKCSGVRTSSNQTTRETTGGVNAPASQQPLMSEEMSEETEGDPEALAMGIGRRGPNG